MQEINNKFCAKLNIYSSLQCWLNIFESFIKHSGKVVLLERPQFVLQKLICLIKERDETL